MKKAFTLLLSLLALTSYADPLSPNKSLLKYSSEYFISSIKAVDRHTVKIVKEMNSPDAYGRKYSIVTLYVTNNELESFSIKSQTRSLGDPSYIMECSWNTDTSSTKLTVDEVLNRGIVDSSCLGI